MSAYTLLEVDCQNVKFTISAIDQIIMNKLLKCNKCSQVCDLSSSRLSIKCTQINMRKKLELLCSACAQIFSQNQQNNQMISLGIMYELLKCFNMFNMKQITKALKEKIYNQIYNRKNLKHFEKRQILRMIYPYFQDELANKNYITFLPLQEKVTILLGNIRQIVQKIKYKQIFSHFFMEKRKENKLSEQNTAFLLRIMREQIALKLESLKNLYKILKNTKQFKNTLEFGQSALYLLHQPLKSFFKPESSKNIIYSLDRRQINLKMNQECEKTQEQELIRLNEPLRNKQVIFKLKCPYRHQSLRIGFLFMSLQDYEAEAEYQKLFQPLQINFNVHSSLQDFRLDYQNEIVLLQTQRSELEVAKHNIMLLKKQRQRNPKKIISTSQSFCQKDKIFTMSFKKGIKNLETKEFDVEDGTLLELKYDQIQKIITIKNLAKETEIYRRKFYKKTVLDMSKLVIFPCVTLTGSDCSVEYILNQ